MCFAPRCADSGCNCGAARAQLAACVQQIYSIAFEAVKSDGSVVTWGGAKAVGTCDAVRAQLAAGVQQICSTEFAFAAVKGDGSVVTCAKKKRGSRRGKGGWGRRAGGWGEGGVESLGRRYGVTVGGMVGNGRGKVSGRCGDGGWWGWGVGGGGGRGGGCGCGCGCVCGGGGGEVHNRKSFFYAGK
jgi:hypothetical protein